MMSITVHYLAILFNYGHFLPPYGKLPKPLKLERDSMAHDPNDPKKPDHPEHPPHPPKPPPPGPEKPPHPPHHRPVGSC